MASRWNSHEVNPDDEEIDADSFSKMTYRRMAVAHPAEGEPNIPTGLHF